MERVLGGGMLPLVLGSLGVLLLYRALLRLRRGAAIQDAVVVITGASSGLGKGTSADPTSPNFSFYATAVSIPLNMSGGGPPSLL